MRRLTAGFATLAMVAACSASGSDAPIDDSSGAQPTGDSHPLPPSDPGDGDDASTPPPKKDAGKDATPDAGPPPPTPGTPCSDPNKIVSKACGACGTQSTVCLASGDGGSATWTDYSTCDGETVGGCVPGTTQTTTCGNCGTQTNTCSKYCAWSNGACTGQPANSCVPLSVDLSSAGCATSNTYRQRDCKTDCTWNNFSGTCAAPPAIIQVPPTEGQASSTLVTLASTKTITRLKDDANCPNETIGTLATPYQYIEVHNPNAKSAIVTIFNSLAPGGPTIHTQLATYAGNVVPTTAAERKACVKGVNTFGDDTISGDSDFSTLTGGDRPTIAPNSSILVYNAGYDAAQVGTVKLTVQLDVLK